MIKAWGLRAGLAIAVLLAAATLTTAAPAPPVKPPLLNPLMLAHDYSRGSDGAPQDQALRIGELNITVDLRGAMARTVVVARFDNPTDNTLEGDFTLSLPAGSLVTGYGLDIDGTMRPGVLTSAAKAKQAYEDKIRQGVDPGLGEVTREGAFHTRVSPVPPGSGRTVRLEFVTAVQPGRPYVLPLVSEATVGRLTLAVRANGLASRPTVTGPDGKVLDGGGDWQNVRLGGALSIADVKPAGGVTFSKHTATGELFFDIIEPEVGGRVAAPPKSVRIYWDRSLSRQDDDRAKEMAVLMAYLRRTAPERIELVSFASDAPTRQVFSTPEQVAAAIAGLTYRGATSLAGVIGGKDEAAADVCLMFTDGQIDLDTWSLTRARCTLSTLSGSADANRPRLAALARRSGGASVDLATADVAAAVDQLAGPRGPVAEVTDAAGQPLTFEMLDDLPGAVRLVGKADEPGDIIVRWRGGGGERRYSPAGGAPTPGDGAGDYWAARRIAALDVSDRPDADAQLAMARRYSVAGAWASFLVLETMNDYVQAGVEPPPSVGAAALADYRRAKSEADETARSDKAERLGEVQKLWSDQKAWWNRKFPAVKPGSRNQGRSRNDGAPPPPPPPPPRPPGIVVPSPMVQPRPAVVQPAAPALAATAPADDDGSTVAADVVVTGNRREETLTESPIVVSSFSQEPLEKAADDNTIEVEVQPWNPERPYLAALKAAGPDGFAAAFTAEEAKWGKTPAFYLDVAEYLFRSGRTAQAVQMALSALEVPGGDNRTLTLVADRMMRYGDMDRGVWLYDRLAWLETERPQPRRALALALIDWAARPGVPTAERKAAGQRAMNLLSEVVMTPWDGDFDGVELIALMEANQLWPTLKALGGDNPLDASLTDLLDVDIRVVLEWNTDATDMDLWVDEPSGERAIFSNQKTAIGGRLSNDMTEGYGPEEYLLRRAPDGEYEIEVNTYDTDTLDQNGATTVRARLYRNWGRPNQSMQTLELELQPGAVGGTPDGEGVVLLGRFRLGTKTN